MDTASKEIFNEISIGKEKSDIRAIGERVFCVRQHNFTRQYNSSVCDEIKKDEERRLVYDKRKAQVLNLIKQIIAVIIFSSICSLVFSLFLFSSLGGMSSSFWLFFSVFSAYFFAKKISASGKKNVNKQS